MTAPAYLIVDMAMSDPGRYREYMAKAQALVKEYGGEYLVRGGRHETIEGDWSASRVVLLRFPSYEQVKAFYDSDAYREVRAMRSGASHFFNMILVEGVDAPV